MTANCPCRKDRPCCHRPAPRRIVLLGDSEDGSAERVLAEPTADAMHREVVRQAAAHPGRLVAAEWKEDGEWVRWVIAGKRKSS